jgi:hypothetical protein
MKTLLRRLALCLLFTAAAFPLSAAPDTRVFELRTYTATPGNLDKVLARFRDHTCKIFERHGMENIGYFVPTDPKEGANDKLVYLIAHKSREAATANWKEFNADPEWQEVRKASEEKGKIVLKTESVFLATTDFSPPIAPEAKIAPRYFELRTYTTAEGKLGALEDRYRAHTLALYARHGIIALGFWHPVDADKGAGSTLYFLLSYPSAQASVGAWQDFGADPEWTKAKAESEKGGKLTTATKSLALAPTDFSPMK